MNFLAPIINNQLVDVNGDPLSGGTVEVYLEESSTPVTTYSDQAGLVPNTWPIVLNTLGLNEQGAVWLLGDVAYKYVIKDANGVVQWDIDNVAASFGFGDQWIPFLGIATYVDPTSFTVPGDQTLILQPGRRVRMKTTGGVVYGTILTSEFNAPSTTVKVAMDSGEIDAGLSALAYGILSPVDTSWPDIADQWITYFGVPTFVDATSFTVAGDQTGTLQVGRRVQSVIAGDARVFSDITASVYTAPNTLVTLEHDAGVLDAGLSLVFYGIISTVDTSFPVDWLMDTYVKPAIDGAIDNALLPGGGISNGINAAIAVTARSATFTADASFTVPPGISAVRVGAAAGGGGGGAGGTSSVGTIGSGGGGGGAGQSIQRGIYAVTPGQVLSIIVGAGGTGGVPTGGNGGDGGDGGTTVVGPLITLAGGAGGGGGITVIPTLPCAGAHGGSGAPTGSSGQDSSVNNASGSGGVGASSPFGGGGGSGRGGGALTVAGTAAGGYGAGGGGGGGGYITLPATGGAGGGGTSGIVMLDW